MTKLFGFFGLERREIQEAKAGDLIAVSGMEDIFVGETITPTDAVEALPVLHIDEPTLQMTFLVNNSPLLVVKVNGSLPVRLKSAFKLSCKQTYLFVLNQQIHQINGLFQDVENCTCPFLSNHAS